MRTGSAFATMRFVSLATSIFVLAMALAAAPQAEKAALQRKSAQAKQLLDKGNFSQAIPLLLELREAAPNDVGLRMALGNAYAATGDFPKAAAEFESVRKSDPAFAPAALALAATQMNLGRSREAVTLLNEFVAREPRNGEARNLLASVYRSTGDLTRANEQLLALAELSPKNARVWHLLYQSYREIAQECFALTEQAAPESAFMVAMAGYKRLEEEEYASAFYLMREALDRKPDLRGPHEALAKIYQVNKQPEWAATETQREEGTPVPDCSVQAGACAFLMGNPAATMEATRFARLPEDLYWRYRAATALRDDAYEKLQALPESVQALGAKAERMRELDRHAEAVAAWRKAISKAPGNPGLEKELVISLYQAKDFAECARMADKLLKTNPEDGDLRLLRGDASLSQQDAKTALPHLEKAVAINPAMLPAHASLGRALLQLGRPAEAVPHLEQALPYDHDGSILYQLSQAYQQSGKTEEGKAALAKYQEFLKRDRAEKLAFEEKFQIVAP